MAARAPLRSPLRPALPGVLPSAFQVDLGLGFGQPAAPALDPNAILLRDGTPLADRAGNPISFR